MSRSLSKHFRPDGGFSVFELLATILLIAAIAVLSLPTYNDFTPHETSSDERLRPSSNDEREVADPLPSGRKIPDQPVLHPVSKKADPDNASPGEGEIGQ